MTETSSNAQEPDDMSVKWEVKLNKEQQVMLAEAKVKLLPYWDIKVLYGRQGAYQTFAVVLTSLMFGGHTRIYLEREFYEKVAVIIRELSDIGFFTNAEFGILLKYIAYLKQSNTVLEVPSLGQADDFISETESTELYEDLVHQILEHRDFFPTLSSHLFIDGDNYGVQLDTPKYRERYRLFDDHVQVFAVSSDFVLEVLGLYDVREARFRDIVRAWIACGFLIKGGTDPKHNTNIVKIGGKQVRLYLFRIDNFQERLHDINTVEGFDK